MKREGQQHGVVRSYEFDFPPASWGNQKRKTRIVNRRDSPPVGGIFSKVTSKPTNHSKFTSRCKGKCGGSLMNPVFKSKDKTKGTQKLKSCDVTINHKLVAWRVVDKGFGLNYAGISATGILRQLSSDYGDDEVEEDDVNGVYDDLPAFVDNLGKGSVFVGDLGEGSRYAEEEEVGVGGFTEEGEIGFGGYIEDQEEEEEEVTIGEIGFGGNIEDEEIGFGGGNIEEEEIGFGGNIEEEEEEEIGFGVNIEEEEEEDDDDDDKMSFCDVGFVMEQVDGEEDWCLVGEI